MIKKYQVPKTDRSNLLVPATINGFEIDTLNLDGISASGSTSLYYGKGIRHLTGVISNIIGTNCAFLNKRVSVTDTRIYTMNARNDTTNILTIAAWDKVTFKQISAETVTTSAINSSYVQRLFEKYYVAFNSSLRKFITIDLETKIETSLDVSAQFTVANQNSLVHHGSFLYFSANNATTTGVYKYDLVNNVVTTLFEKAGASGVAILKYNNKLVYISGSDETGTFYTNLLNPAETETALYKDFPVTNTAYSMRTKPDNSYEFFHTNYYSRGALVPNGNYLDDILIEVDPSLRATGDTYPLSVAVDETHIYINLSNTVLRAEKANLIYLGKFYYTLGARTFYNVNITVPPNNDLFFNGITPFVTVKTVI